MCVWGLIAVFQSIYGLVHCSKSAFESREDTAVSAAILFPAVGVFDVMD